MASPNHLLANEELVEQMDIKVNITHYPKVTLHLFGMMSLKISRMMNLETWTKKWREIRIGSLVSDDAMAIRQEFF